jgi:Uma2 family endonuclease
MVSPGPKIKLTYEDYAKTPDDERYELIDGELLMVPSPNRPHQWTVIHLGTRLIAFVEENDLGEVYFAPFDVVLSDTNVVQPDVIFVSRERLGIITHANIQGAPDLVVEVRSPSTAYRDLTIKRRLYAEHGVKEYWMVDPEARTITVLLLRNGDFEEVGIYQKGQTLSSPTLEEARTVTVLLLRDGVFEEVGIYRKGQVLSSTTLSGFTLNLDEIFRD